MLSQSLDLLKTSNRSSLYCSLRTIYQRFSCHMSCTSRIINSSITYSFHLYDSKIILSTKASKGHLLNGWINTVHLQCRASRQNLFRSFSCIGPPKSAPVHNRFSLPTDSKVSDDGWKNNQARTTPTMQERLNWQVQKDALKKKFNNKSWAPQKRLSPDALEGIRAMHAQFPDKFTTPVLAEQFKMSPEAIRRILRSKWKPTLEEYEARMERWDRRGQKIWSKRSEEGLKPPKKWREKGIGKMTQRERLHRQIVRKSPMVRIRRKNDRAGRGLHRIRIRANLNGSDQ